ncbi:hypothetical protein M3Y98_00166000 [Aphelenchoides besseyi]|nr:hypothetical protein M3Y98_00166000 [Aphelenchoides besseyi]KAI6199956.1 hypothetical protein M3Y96_00682100 [Aphelenchoides besseyi]
MAGMFSERPSLSRYDSVSHYALGLLNDALSSSTKSNADVKSVVSGSGNASEIYCIQLNNGGYSSSMIAKIPNQEYVHGQWDHTKSVFLLPNDHNRKVSSIKTEMLVADLHNREVLFLRYASLNIQNELKFPTLYHGDFISDDQDGIILMEDFTKQVSNIDTHTLSISQVELLIDEICKLQIGCVNDRELVEHFPLLDSQLEVISRNVIMSVGVLDNRRLSWFTKSVQDRVCKLAEPSQLRSLLASSNGINVLCHGNLTVKDTLWHQTNDSQFEILSIIDWQCSHVGSQTTDLATALAVNLTSFDRQKAECELIRRYVNNWNKIDGMKKLSLSEVKLMYQESLKYAVLILLTNLNTNKCIDNSLNDILIERLKSLIGFV